MVWFGTLSTLGYSCFLASNSLWNLKLSCVLWKLYFLPSLRNTFCPISLKHLGAGNALGEEQVNSFFIEAITTPSPPPNPRIHQPTERRYAAGAFCCFHQAMEQVIVNLISPFCRNTSSLQHTWTLLTPAQPTSQMVAFCAVAKLMDWVHIGSDILNHIRLKQPK